MDVSEVKILDGSCILPLDGLDLNLFRHDEKKDQKTGLWTNEEMQGESQLCQVETFSDEKMDDDCFVASENFTCHICNVDVPVLCAEQHGNSEKHTNYNTLFDKVLNRITRQMSSADDKDEECKASAPENSHYCDTCCKFINNEDKRQHLLSNYHKKSVEHDTLVKDFTKMFDMDEQYDTTDTDNLNTHNGDSDEEFTLQGKKIIIFDEYNNEFEIYKIKIKLSKNNTIELNITANDDAMKLTESKYLEKHIKEFIKKHKLSIKLPIIQDNTVIIEMNKGEWVKMPLHNYLSYKKIEDVQYCQMCQTPCNGSHDVNDTHLQNILKPINENYTRSIDDTSSHCLLCNDTIETSLDHHTCNEDHKDILNGMRTSTPELYENRFVQDFYKLYSPRGTNYASSSIGNSNDQRQPQRTPSPDIYEQMIREFGESAHTQGYGPFDLPYYTPFFTNYCGPFLKHLGPPLVMPQCGFIMMPQYGPPMMLRGGLPMFRGGPPMMLRGGLPKMLQGGPPLIPQGSPPMMPQGGTPMIPQGSPPMMPQSTPPMMPQDGPPIKPQSGPLMGPEERPAMKSQVGPAMKPQSSPPMIPQGGLLMMPQGCPAMMSQGGPPMVPEGSAMKPRRNRSKMPQGGLSMVPRGGPPKMPETSSPKMPQSGPPQKPQSGPPKMPQSPPKMPQSGPPKMPQSGPPKMPQSGLAKMPKSGPAKMPQSGPPKMPQSGPPMMPQGGPALIPQSCPPKMPQGGPAMMPQSESAVVPQSEHSMMPLDGPAKTTQSGSSKTGPNMMPQSSPAMSQRAPFMMPSNRPIMVRHGIGPFGAYLYNPYIPYYNPMYPPVPPINPLQVPNCYPWLFSAMPNYRPYPPFSANPYLFSPSPTYPQYLPWQPISGQFNSRASSPASSGPLTHPNEPAIMPSPWLTYEYPITHPCVPEEKSDVIDTTLKTLKRSKSIGKSKKVSLSNKIARKTSPVKTITSSNELSNTELTNLVTDIVSKTKEKPKLMKKPIG